MVLLLVVWCCCWWCGATVGDTVCGVSCDCWRYDVAVGCVLLVVVAWCVVMFVMSCWCDVMALMVPWCRGVVVLEYCGVVTTCSHLVSNM